MRISENQFPVGHSITGSPHSVCVSLPTMADVIAYEEKKKDVLDQFQSGYPRFFKNPLITNLEDSLESEGQLMEGDDLLPALSVAEDLADFIGGSRDDVYHIKDNFHAVRVFKDPSKQDLVRQYLQHTGNRISSREAETSLAKSVGITCYHEERVKEGAEALIIDHLHSVYNTASPDDIYLFRGGMNAFYAAYRALSSIQTLNDRTIWIQLGWLYVDTTKILEKWRLNQQGPVTVYNVMDLSELKDILKNIGHSVAGIVTEVPTNPLVQTTDIEELRSLADRYGIALILDPSLVSPHNVNILPFSDIHINSLTKYAASSADTMVGALALNHRSKFYDDLRENLPSYGTPPADEDLNRLAHKISDYEALIEQVNQSTPKVAEFLERHPAVEKVYWAKAQPGGYNYNWIQHRAAGPGSIISFTLKGDLQTFYDSTRIVKSPSFGASFSMLCPFMYLAHYELVSSVKGRQFLKEQNLSPNLIRLSLGKEDPLQIIEELDRSL